MIPLTDFAVYSAHSLYNVLERRYFKTSNKTFYTQAAIIYNSPTAKMAVIHKKHHKIYNMCMQTNI